MNPSNRRSRRRRSPRPFAVLLIVGGVAVLGYNLWPAAESNQEQVEAQAEPTNAPSTVAVNDESPATEPEGEEATEASTPAALPEVVEAQSPEPTAPSTVPTDLVVPVESNSDASPAVRERALADFASGMRLLRDGLGVEGRQRLSDALGSGGLDEARASEVRVALSQLSETLVFGSGVAQRDPFAREFIIPKVAGQDRPEPDQWFALEVPGTNQWDLDQIAFDLANA